MSGNVEKCRALARILGMGALCVALPDADVIGFRFGVLLDAKTDGGLGIWRGSRWGFVNPCGDGTSTGSMDETHHHRSLSRLRW
jgi:hypothetical protein